MGFIGGILKRIIKLFLYLGVLIAIILFVPNLPPYTKFTSIEIDPTQPRTGALALNGDLNNVEKLYIDKLLGPESFQLWNGELYTSLATGEIVKISNAGHVTFVTQIGQPCIGLVHEHVCGRPLGFVIDEKNKQMYVADAYYGIWKIDLKSYRKQLLVSPRVEIEGRKPMLFNYVALAPNGDLYWTDSSSDYNLKDGIYAIISDPSGRLFRYNPAKNESTVLLDNLWFANGVVISPDNQFVLVVETNHMRLLKYYIDGPKKGLTEVFVSGLPGTPDTVRVLPDGSGVLVAMYAVFDDEHPLLTKTLASTPLARKFAARFMRLLEIPFEFLNTQFPHIIFEQILYNIGHFTSVSGWGPGLSGIVQIDWNGNIVASHYNTDNSISHISDAFVFNDKLYLGCPHAQNFIGSVPAPPLLKKAFNVAKPSSPPTKVPAAEKKQPQKDKKVTVQQPKQNIKVEKPVEQKANQKTEKPSQSKVKTDAQKQPPVDSNAVPKAAPKASVKEETPKSAPKVTENKSKQKNEAVPEPPKQNSPSTPPPTKADPTASKPKVVPETKPKIAPKIEERKEAVPESEKTSEPKPKETPKAEEKKAAPKVDSKKIDDKKTEKQNKAPSNEKSVPKTDTPKPTPKPGQKKQDGKAKKAPIHDEPQIIVQKVVPDEIPIQEDIPSDTAKPKAEPLKVIKKSGPVEIPTPNI